MKSLPEAKTPFMVYPSNMTKEEEALEKAWEVYEMNLIKYDYIEEFAKQLVKSSKDSYK